MKHSRLQVKLNKNHDKNKIKWGDKMEEKTIIIRQEATKEVLDEIYRVVRKIAAKLPPEKAKEYFYTEEELKEIKKQKKDSQTGTL